MFELIIAFGVGVFVGWIIVEKPEWARNLGDKIKNWIGMKG